MKTKNTLKKLTFILTVVLVSGIVWAQDGIEKKVLGIEDYMLWRSIGSTSISGDGAWITYSYSRRNEDGVMTIKHLESDKSFEVERGGGPSFSDDNQWIAYSINAPVRRPGQEPKEGEESKRKMELLELATGDKYSVDNFSSFSFSKGSKYFIVRKSGSGAGGSDLLLRNLETGMNELIGNVSQFAVNKGGNLLAYVVNVEDKAGNGIYLNDLESGIRRPLDTDKAEYARMTWDEEGTALAVMKGVEKEGFVHKENTVLVFTDMDEGQPVKVEYDPSEAFDFPKDMVISELAGLSISPDVSKVFFGIKEQEKKIEKSKNGEPIPDVDIFHWNDDRLQSVQKLSVNRDKNFTYQGVFHLESKRFVRLTDEKMKQISLTRDGKWGIGQDSRAYVSDWKPRVADYYRVNTETGARDLIFEAHERTMGLSPDSKHYLYWRDHQVWDYEITSGKKTNLTRTAPVSFVDTEDDHTGSKRSYGVTGWTKDGKAVVLTHRYDLYLQPLDGSRARCLTNNYGDKNEIRLRYNDLDREERFIDLSKPIMLTAFGQWTKKSGFYELKDGKLEQLIFEDKKFGRLVKAKEADKFMFTISTFRDFPDYYISDMKFSYPKRVTDANPQQAEYRWGDRILFDYTNNDGVRLQGTLAIPDGYEEGDKLPMLVNFYEKYSQNLHSYYAPRYASSPQFAGFVSRGYLVMQPDVHFRTRTSHSDMLECVEAAIKKVIEMGYVDPERVGLHGHSYSGGGSAYISTRSKMFAAIAAGAAPINLTSEFNQLFTGSGQNNHSYDIYGQGRYGTNPYDDPELYRQQSAITHVRTMNTPLLYLHGVDDPTVEYLQGMEFYNALRFNEKPVVFLSYPGEGHGLRRFENQKDFTIRLHQFFDHYLKDAPAPEWITKGVPYLKKLKMQEAGKIIYKD